MYCLSDRSLSNVGGDSLRTRDLGEMSTMEALLPASYVYRNMLSLPLIYTCGRIESGGLSKPDRKRPPPRETRLGWFIQRLEYIEDKYIGIFRSRTCFGLTTYL